MSFFVILKNCWASNEIKMLQYKVLDKKQNDIGGRYCSINPVHSVRGGSKNPATESCGIFVPTANLLLN